MNTQNKKDKEMAEKIYTEWCSLRRSVGRKATAFTDKRRKHINDLLENHYGENIVLVLSYIKTSNDYYAKFMRGENDRNREYTGFDNVFRPQKMSAKIDKAIAWEKTRLKKDTYNNDGMYFPYRIMEA